MLGEKVSSFLLIGRYFLIWNLSKTHPSYIPSELFFLKEPIDPKQMQTRASGTHLGIEFVLLSMDLVTTTPLSKSSLETCQDFALLSLEEQKESWHWANKAPKHQTVQRHLSNLMRKSFVDHVALSFHECPRSLTSPHQSGCTVTFGSTGTWARYWALFMLQLYLLW